MLKKILVANRGEIACRVMATAKRLGIETVALYSETDREAEHVLRADESVFIGASPASESYLVIDKIVAAALQTKADSIHPGYGFLSENPDFVRAVERAGLVFIGPSAESIEAMGLKDAAKSLMESHHVPVIPGYHGTNQDTKFLANQAEKIGYPVLIKARAGGGGKGMRLVKCREHFEDALEGAKREGEASFGDGNVLIEKYIEKPRHIEVQVFGDHYGHIVHFFDRDCSLQRRHQKVIEEAPAPHLDEEVRQAICQSAVRAAKSVNYYGAGTVEFIAGGTGGITKDSFWFMEMNTRLQVEHPVSEAITGYDFVELQLRIATGLALPKQSEITINGHAMEARFYAEDVHAGFLPASGRIEHLRFPMAEEFTISFKRIDSGIKAGDEISPYYDPMIAKFITHGHDRESARLQLESLLSHTEIIGITTNLGFLVDLIQHQSFRDGDVDTHLIEQNLSTLATKPKVPLFIDACAVMIKAGFEKQRPLQGFRLWEDWINYIYLQQEQRSIRTVIRSLGDRQYLIDFGDEQIVFHMSELVNFMEKNDTIFIFDKGYVYQYTELDDHHTQEDDNKNVLLSPMPGLVGSLFVHAGQSVEKGEKLLILEAMKMEYHLTAPKSARIKRIFVQEGEQIKADKVLVEFIEDE